MANSAKIVSNRRSRWLENLTVPVFRKDFLQCKATPESNYADYLINIDFRSNIIEAIRPSLLKR